VGGVSSRAGRAFRKSTLQPIIMSGTKNSVNFCRWGVSHDRQSRLESFMSFFLKAYIPSTSLPLSELITHDLHQAFHN
jgi:hypothetical protein